MSRLSLVFRMWNQGEIMDAITQFHVITAVMIASIGLGGSAYAQTPTEAVPDLTPFIGQRIEVTDEDGRVVTGQLIRVSEASVVVKIDHIEAELESLRIRAVNRWRKDSVANGILIGAGLGFVIPAFIAAAVDTGEPGEAAALLIPPGVTIGLAVGWIVDALHRTKIPIFPAPPRVTIAPVWGDRRRGFQANLRF